MRPFITSLLQNKFFNLRDVTLFHLLPDVPYYAGVYEISNSAFAKMAGVDADTAKSFFEKLESSGLVTVLRSGSKRGKNATFAFTKRESTLHKNNYRSSGPVSDNYRDFSVPSGTRIHIISHTLNDNAIPKNFFRPGPSDIILSQLNQLLHDPAYANESVVSLLNEYILVRGASPRRNRLSRVG